MIGAVAVSAMSGCGLLNSNKERRVREYLLGLKGVDSVDVYVELLGDQGYRWTVRVRLSDDPPQDALITVVGESFDKVAEIAESQTVDMEVAWAQGSTGVRWSSKATDATKAVETVAGLCTPAVDGIEVNSGGALVRYRAVDSFPDNWMVPPSSDALSLSHRDFEQHIRIGGLSVSTRYTGHADLSSVPLERVFEAMSPADRNREGASIELDDMDFVHGQVQLSVAAFGSYEDGPAHAFASAARLMKAGAHAVKLEGGAPRAHIIRSLVDAGIPVCAHLGYTPQSENALGGPRMQGRGEAGQAMGADARAVQEAGAFALVLEMVPSTVAARITAELDIPTIGIGAGPDTDGQVLVWSDMAGMSDWAPSFVRRFAELGSALTAAAGDYVAAVRDGSFPGEGNFKEQ